MIRARRGRASPSNARELDAAPAVTSTKSSVARVVAVHYCWSISRAATASPVRTPSGHSQGCTPCVHYIDRQKLQRPAHCRCSPSATCHLLGTNRETERRQSLSLPRLQGQPLVDAHLHQRRDWRCRRGRTWRSHRTRRGGGRARRHRFLGHQPSPKEGLDAPDVPMPSYLRHTTRPVTARRNERARARTALYTSTKWSFSAR
jgi:hypothetical protein